MKSWEFQNYQCLRVKEFDLDSNNVEVLCLKTLLSLYLVLTIAFTQFFAAYFYSKGRTNYRKAFSVLLLCVSVYLFGYLMVINSSNLQEMMFWNQIQYMGLPFIAVLWLVVALLNTIAVVLRIFSQRPMMPCTRQKPREEIALQFGAWDERCNGY